MVDKHTEHKKATKKEIVLATIGGLFAPLLAIILIILFIMKINETHLPDKKLSQDTQAVVERTAPVGQVEVAKAEQGNHIDKTGEEVVQAVCSACHATGALGSPKIGDKSLWAPRIAQGYETLINHAKNGIRAMPPRGGNPALTDIEIARAIAVMANQSGANFKAP